MGNFSVFHNACINVIKPLLSLVTLENRLAILTFHRVLMEQDNIISDHIDETVFSWQMSLIAKHFNVMRLTEAVERLKANSLPARALCITFDDGYADNYTVALPVLKKMNLNATFFIATGFLNGGRMWNDTLIEAVRRVKGESLDMRQLGLDVYDITSDKTKKRTIYQLINKLKYYPVDRRHEKIDEIKTFIGVTLPNNLMMSDAQVKDLYDHGMEIGGHTVNHPILSRISDKQAEEEIIANKHVLEEIIGAPLVSFAYPNGKPDVDFKSRDMEIVKQAGYMCAVSTASGVAGKAANLYQLPRIDIWDRRPLKYALRLLMSYSKKKYEQTT